MNFSRLLISGPTPVPEKCKAAVALSRLAFGKAYTYTDRTSVCAEFRSDEAASAASNALCEAKMLHARLGRLLTVRFDWAGG